MQARARTDASEVTRVAIDETAARRGHDYITLFVDIDQARVLFATEGKDADTVAAFADDLAAHGGDPAAVSEVCIDMSPAFIKGVADSLPKAAVTFDKFHAVKIINDAVDQVRRAEQKQQGLLRGTRYIWLRNPDNLSERQRATLESLPTRHLKTARAYQIRLAFQDLYDQPSEAAVSFLKRWYFWATHSRLEPMIDAAHTVKRHWDGILRWFDSKIANGLIEGINSLVQAAKAKARGYRSIRNLKAMVYLARRQSSTSDCPRKEVTHAQQRGTKSFHLIGCQAGMDCLVYAGTDALRWTPPMTAVSPVRSLSATRQPADLRHDRAARARHRALLPSRRLRGWRAVCPATPQTGPAGRPASALRPPTVAVDCGDRRVDGIG